MQCEHIYFDPESKKPIPNGRHFAITEFEELYSQIPIIEYLFENGIEILDMAILNNIVNELRELHPEWDLKIDSFHARSTPKAVFTIIDANLVKHAFETIKNTYESDIARLEGGWDVSTQMMDKILSQMVHQNKIEHVHKGDIVNTLNINQGEIINNSQINNQEIVFIAQSAS